MKYKCSRDVPQSLNLYPLGHGIAAVVRMTVLLDFQIATQHFDLMTHVHRVEFVDGFL